MKWIWNAIRTHKKTSAFLLLLLVGSGIWIVRAQSSTGTETRYVLSAVEKGTLMTSVSGTGQVQGEAEIEIKPEVSGKVTQVVAKNGQEVQEGDVLVVLDSTDAYKAVRDAQLNLESAQLSYDDLTASTDALSLLQAQNALAQAERTLTDLQNGATDKEIRDAEDSVASAERSLDQANRDLEETQTTSAQDLIAASEDGYNAVSEAFTELSGVMDDLAGFIGTSSSEEEYIGYYDLLAGSTYTDGLRSDYHAAQDSYDSAWADYRASSHDSDADSKSALISSALTTVRDIANTLNDAQTLLNKIQEEDYSDSAIEDHIDEMITTIPADINTVNGDLSALQSAHDTIESTSLRAPFDVQNAEAAVQNAEANLAAAQAELADLADGADANDLAAAQEDVAEKRQQVEDLQAGADESDLRSAQITLQERKNTRNDALEALATYSVRAPVAGKLANLVVHRGESVSSGTALATVVANQLTATVSLNEVDVAKVDAGDKATLAFDALEDLSITGEVADVDIIGTVSQGVVSYNVLIVFDTQDDRVRSGMSISATIITEVRQDVLTVASSAIKTQGDVVYVETLDHPDPAQTGVQGVTSPDAPRQVQVGVGLSNDTDTEITSGLNEGDQVITRTITGSAAAPAPASSTPSLFGGSSGGRGVGMSSSR